MRWFNLFLVILATLVASLSYSIFATPKNKIKTNKSNNMTQIHTFVFNHFHQNTYLLSDDTKECVIIDPGCFFDEEKQALKDFIEKQGLKPVKILFTHCHLDHAFGARYVFTTWPGISIVANRGEEIFITEAQKHASRFGVQMEQPPLIGNFINDGDTLTFGNTTLTAIHVPGHSPGSICYYNADQAFMITGDVIFEQSVGRTDLPGGSTEQLITGIKTKIMTLPDNTVLYPGHGNSTTVGNEKRNNPYIR